MKRILVLTVIAGALALAVSAQPRYQDRYEERHATLGSGGGDSGKCTIEVNVDEVAEVEIAWDLAKLHTLAGQPSQWRRFECSSPLPPAMAEFRFSGVDGRGRQTLTQDPRNNHGLAVIRIEDPRGGREGYTFDIEWRGGRVPPPPPPPFVGGDRRDGDRGRDGGGRWQADRAIAACQDAIRDRASRDYRFRDLDFRRSVFDDGPGRRDYVIGTFVARDRGDRDEYTFSCRVDFDGRRIGDVQIQRRDRR